MKTELCRNESQRLHDKVSAKRLRSEAVQGRWAAMQCPSSDITCTWG